jgi:hypothetical protein
MYPTNITFFLSTTLMMIKTIRAFHTSLSSYFLLCFDMMAKKEMGLSALDRSLLLGKG